MRGDYTRFGFDRSKRFSGVLMQQGRVSLDSDSKESPAWTDFNTSDPGVTLVELFAFLAETLLSQIDEQRRRRRRARAWLVVGSAGVAGLFVWTRAVKGPRSF